MSVDKYEKDLDTLIKNGQTLLHAIQYECEPKEFERIVRESLGDVTTAYIRTLPSFRNEYQTWYTEAKALLQQILPERLSDFTSYYEKQRSRKDITFENYTIEDFLVDLRVTRGGGSVVVGPYAAIPRFRQQLSIVESIRGRFRSTLFDIRQLTQADLFDSELDAAKELAKGKFNRAAGVVAGVVLERHLSEVCANHKVTMRKKSPQISDLNDALKKANVIETPQWRAIQYLGDIRNLCAHNKDSEPTADQVRDILDGVTKVTKTVF